MKSNLAENVGKFLIYLDTIYENIYPNSASIITRKEIYMILHRSKRKKVKCEEGEEGRTSEANFRDGFCRSGLNL